MLVARSADQLAETEQEIRKINDQVQVLAVPTNVIDEDSVTSLFEKVKAQFGTADVLVNNAGMLNAGTIDSVDVRSWWYDFVSSFSSLPPALDKLALICKGKIGDECQGNFPRD